MSKFDTDFGTVELLEFGQQQKDRVIILLHGAASGARPMQKLAQELAADYHILVPNLCGYGASRHDNNKLSPLQQHLDVVASVLDRYNKTQYHLIGHSMGGFVTLKTALTQPRRAASITVIEPMVFGILDPLRDAESIAADRNNIVLLAEKLRQGKPAEGLAGFIDYWNDMSWQQVPDKLKQTLISLSAQISRETDAISLDKTPPSAYTQLDCPTLLLSTERTQQPVPRIMEELQNLLPHAQHQQIPAVGHMGPVSHPELFAVVIRQFLARL